MRKSFKKCNNLRFALRIQNPSQTHAGTVFSFLTQTSLIILIYNSLKAYTTWLYFSVQMQ